MNEVEIQKMSEENTNVFMFQTAIEQDLDQKGKTIKYKALKTNIKLL